MSDRPQTQIARAGRCAIVGRPNVGKSTLLNALLKQKLVIATPRPGTTRSNVLGVYVSERPPTQIAFIDTPGMERPRNALERVLADRASEGLLGCDVILHVAEVPKRGAPSLVHEDDARIIERVQDTGTDCVLAINKVDALRSKETLLPFIEAMSERARFAAVVPISALRNDGLDALIQEIAALLPQGRLFDEDVLTDRPERFFVTELIREAAMHATRQEVPRGIAVTLDGYVEEKNLVRIDATLIVDKSSHKGIVLGARGATIKKIGIDARKEIEALIERHVMLKLWVKVIPGWTRDPDKAHQIVHEAEKS